MPNSVSSTSEKYSLAGFFSGVGGIELGFVKSGEFRVVYTNEFDKNAQETYSANFDSSILDKRDINDVNPSDVPYSDIIVGGFPCQAFSIAGYRKGFEDERGELFFELLRIIEVNKPRAIFLENVKNMVGHDHGNTFKVIREALVCNGYNIHWKVMNGKDYGNIPQNRERIYVVGFLEKEAYNNFSFPEKINLTKELNEIIDYDTKMDEKYYYREGKQPFYEQLEESVLNPESIYQWRRRYVRENKSGVIPTLTANMGTGGHNVPIILTKNGIRKLTPRETFNAQGYPKSFVLPSDMSNGQLYKQAGNSVVVTVIERIAEQISKALKSVKQTNLPLHMPYSSGYIMTDTMMEGKNYGYSELIESFSSYTDAEEYIANNQINIFSDDDYFRMLSKNKSGKFYSLVHI